MAGGAREHAQAAVVGGGRDEVEEHEELRAGGLQRGVAVGIETAGRREILTFSMERSTRFFHQHARCAAWGADEKCGQGISATLINLIKLI